MSHLRGQNGLAAMNRRLAMCFLLYYILVPRPIGSPRPERNPIVVLHSDNQSLLYLQYLGISA